MYGRRGPPSPVFPTSIFLLLPPYFLPYLHIFLPSWLTFLPNFTIFPFTLILVFMPSCLHSCLPASAIHDPSQQSSHSETEAIAGLVQFGYIGGSKVWWGTFRHGYDWLFSIFILQHYLGNYLNSSKYST